MYEIQTDLLWIGHAQDARDPRLLFDSGIEAVIDVAYEELPAQLPRELIYCRFPIIDGGGNNPIILKQIVQTIVDLLAAGSRTMVACSAGMSRSPTFAAVALSILLNEKPEDDKKIGIEKSLEVSGALWSEVVGIIPKVRSG